MEKRLKTIVVGIGRLGSFHTSKYKDQLQEETDLVALIDPQLEQVKEKFPTVPVFNDLQSFFADPLSSSVDIASIATPTEFHKDVALKLLERNIHVLIEKPIAMDSLEAKEIVDFAQKKNLFVSVGHVERHRVHSVFQDFGRPTFIECHRLAPFSARSTDINVVMDLMIHDLDLMLAVVDSELKSVHAAGFSVLTQKIDIANARFEFENGCVANLTSSRISQSPVRKFRMFSEEAYLSLDTAENNYNLFFKNKAATDLSNMIQQKKGDLEVSDPLFLEIRDFVCAVKENREPLVSGLDGLRAQKVAENVLADIERRITIGS